MTLTILRILLLRLWNNPLELLLVFVVPVVFFSLFAMIFIHGIATGENKKVRIVIVDPDDSELGKDVTKAFTENAAIICEQATTVTDQTTVDAFIRECQAAKTFDLIVRVLPEETSTTETHSPSLAVITDGQNPMALAIVQSLLKGFFLQQRAQAKLSDLQSSLPGGVGEEGRLSGSSVRQGGSTHQRLKSNALLNMRKTRDVKDVFRDDPPDFISETDPQTIPNGQLETFDEPEESDEKTKAEVDEPMNESLPTSPEEIDFVIKNPQSDNLPNPRVAMYAAGIAVLFLLFSATGNAATILEEQETGTLDRILASRAGLIHIVIGKWLGIFVLGCLQITVMFVWAEMIFGIQLLDHLPGFCIMTASTSAATASFAMFLATLSRSRAQLSALSVLIILSMSALGGSMIPRFAMSDQMKVIGQWTFNAWAIDGFQKVFWYRLPIDSLQNETLVLCGSSLILGLSSYVLSSRWKMS